MTNKVSLVFIPSCQIHARDTLPTSPQYLHCLASFPRFQSQQRQKALGKRKWQWELRTLKLRFDWGIWDKTQCCVWLNVAAVKGSPRQFHATKSSPLHFNVGPLIVLILGIYLVYTPMVCINILRCKLIRNWHIKKLFDFYFNHLKMSHLLQYSFG